jgi:hypothetical protein
VLFNFGLCLFYSLQTCAKEPLESPEFLEKNKVDIAVLRDEMSKELLWYKEKHAEVADS